VDMPILLWLSLTIPRCTGVGRWQEMSFRGLWICWLVRILSQRVKLHGCGIVLHIQRVSNESLQALHRVEQSAWISPVWARTETNRTVKDDRLTVAGRRQPGETEESFEQLVKGIREMLRYA
jgi:PadR family transcriptional regulator PadR